MRQGDHYVVNGQKIWISTAQVAHKILLLARTTPIEEVKSPRGGLSLFYTDLDRSKIEVREIEKLGRKAVDSNELFIDGLRVPCRGPHRRGGQGLRLHPARHQPGAHPARGGSHRARPRRAQARGAVRERARRVRPADRHEPGHPASAGGALDGARGREPDDAQGGLAVRPGAPCGAEANAAKYLGAEAGFRACETAVLTHGGMGYAKEFHVERYFREAMLPRIAPVSPQLIFCFIAEKVLGLPKSY